MTTALSAPLVLASQSAARAALLRAAGVNFVARAASIDEMSIKESLLAEGASAREIAESLAELKAQRVSTQAPQAYVIGADQVLECGGRLFDKPYNRDGARAQLTALQGRRHELISSVVLAHGGQVIWRDCQVATLTLRALDEAAIETYLDLAGEAILSCVGAYQIEGLGVNLMAAITGDHFTIQGLPLLGLLAQLRRLKLVQV
jgi:septum formation protein